MRLKSLELHGYKTFANRTTFEFAGAVTAIVGPNGSGKSNITDALRWVLGEQSYGLLRGKKTEDMIFSGSEQRSRAGMAAATVVLDNQDGWLPIDFSEVAITRRAYRDGQNEYLLNGQRVRLRDVSELLAKSGLAERTYTIIGQGLVDAALALKAEERRRLFEEAAGIGLYRSRREEALRRLDTTLRNLDRVQDILAELEPRLKSLERQSQRAREHERVRSELREALSEWYGYHWQRSQVELTEARDLARQQEQQLVAARQVQSDLDAQLNAARETIRGIRARLDEWHQQSRQYHRQRESVSREVAVYGERLRALVEQREQAGLELLRYEEEIAIQQARLDSVSQEQQRLESELDDGRQQLELARRDLEKRLSERRSSEQAISAARERLASLQSKHSHSQIRLAESQAQARRLTEQSTSLRQRATAAATEQKAAETQLQNSQAALLAAGEARAQFERDLHAIQERVAESETQLMELIALRAAREADAAKIRTQLDIIEQAEQALTTYSSGARAILRAARRGALRGVRGALSSQLEVAADYESAISAVLGEFLDTVLLEGDTEIEATLRIIEAETARAALLPLDYLVPGGMENRLSQDFSEDLKRSVSGFLGVATEMVKAPAELQVVIDLFLGHTLVVSDREVAQKTIDHLPKVLRADPWARVVTLHGEVYHANGLILAGQEGQPRTLGLNRQRRDLAESLGNLQDDIRDVNEKISSLQRALAALRDQHESVTKTMQASRQLEEKTQISYRQSALALQQTSRQLDWLQEQIERLAGEAEQREMEAAKIKAELSTLEASITGVQEGLRDLTLVLAELPVEEFRSQVSHWELRCAVMERAIQDVSGGMRERQESLEKASRSLQETQARLHAFEAEVEQLQSQRVRLQQAESGVAESIDAQSRLIEPAEQELKEAEAGQQILQQSEAEARLASNLCEQRHAQAKITLARRQEALESWRRRIEDDFGLVAFEYTQEVSGPTPLPLEGLVEELPIIHELSPDIEENVKRQRALLRRLGAVNPEAQSEYRQVRERFQFLTEQMADLRQAEGDIRQVVAELDTIMEEEFARTFQAVAGEFRQIFIRLFGGGSARLVLTEPNDLSSSGIDIEARLPGRREQGLSLLSGGERSLTAVALVFALLRVSPTPFCVLDEVDAMLDEANVSRFRELLRELSETTQFVIITHNRNTVQVADVLYGVTMGRDSASQVISLKLDEEAGELATG